jgi:NAD(P)H-hydrate epimerase
MKYELSVLRVAWYVISYGTRNTYHAPRIHIRLKLSDFENILTGEKNMIKVVTADEMREKDRFTIDNIGVPGVVLMENAGRAAFRVIQRELEGVVDPLVYVFCGKGNNGGDGFVVARHLWNEGIYVRIFCIVSKSQLSGDALTNYNIIKNMKIPVEFINTIEDIRELENEPPDLLVDALFGTGIQGMLEGFAKEVIEFINKNIETRVIAIDLPSGLDASSPEVPGSAIRADITITMALPKRCHVFYPAKNYVGELYIADIGIPPFVLNKDDVKVDMLEEADIVLPYRYPDAHKYECGRVGVLAGSKGYTGAAYLAAQAAMKIGAGLVILGVPESLNPLMEQKLTEVITRPLPETREQTIHRGSLAAIKELMEWSDVLAIGPGLGRSEKVQEVIIDILKEFDKPVVIDADALFALAAYPDILKEGPHPNWILTPHLGEFVRFFPGESKETIAPRRLEKAREFAATYGLTLLLKGAPSLVAMPDERVYLNPTGNAGLASGGTGDVLTGLIAGLLAQQYDPDEAAYTANFIHGYTADFITEKETIYTLLAGDLLDNLGPALNALLKKP